MGTEFWQATAQLGATLFLGVVGLVIFSKILLVIVDKFQSMIGDMVKHNQEHIEKMTKEFSEIRKMEVQSSQERNEKIAKAFEENSAAFKGLEVAIQTIPGIKR